jgi:hypothetical protein
MFYLKLILQYTLFLPGLQLSTSTKVCVCVHALTHVEVCQGRKQTGNEQKASVVTGVKIKN